MQYRKVLWGFGATCSVITAHLVNLSVTLEDTTQVLSVYKPPPMNPVGTAQLQICKPMANEKYKLECLSFAMQHCWVAGSSSYESPKSILHSFEACNVMPFP